MKKILLLIACLVSSHLYAATYPTISKQPTDQTIIEGGIASFLIVSTGAVPLSFQWQKNPATGVYENIPGATDSTLTLPDTPITYNGYRFRCSVSNSYGKALSNPGILFVNPEISTSPPKTIYILDQDQVNVIKEGIWVNVFKTVSNLDDSYFVGMSTDPVNTIEPSWFLVNADTTTGVSCFTSTITARAVSPIYELKLRLVNLLLGTAWDDATFPYDSFKSLDEAREAGVFH